MFLIVNSSNNHLIMKTAIVVDDDFDTVDVFCQLLKNHQISVVGKGHNGIINSYLKWAWNEKNAYKIIEKYLQPWLIQLILKCQI